MRSQRSAWHDAHPDNKGRYSDKHGTLVSRLQLFRRSPDGCSCLDCGKSLSWDAPKGPDQIIVRYLDGDTLNVKPGNLTAVCPACQNATVKPRNETEQQKRQKKRLAA